MFDWLKKNRKYNILVIGEDSMLGHDVMNLLTRESYNRESCIGFVRGVGHDELDITTQYALDKLFCYDALGTNEFEHAQYDDPPHVEDCIRKLKKNGRGIIFDFVVNCAAMTDTTAAETDHDLTLRSYAVNALGPRFIAETCNRWGAHLIHISTDYVFSEWTRAYKKFTESYSLCYPHDVEYPVNNYGMHKLLGELFIKQSMKPEEFAILRTSWLYGTWKNKSFIHKFLKNVKNAVETANLVETGIEDGPTKTDKSTKADKKVVDIEVNCNEYSVPTSTADLAQMIYNAIKFKLSGVLHACGLSDNGVTRLEWAERIIAGIKRCTHLFDVVSVVPPQSKMEPVDSVDKEKKPTMHYPFSSNLGLYDILQAENGDQSIRKKHVKLTQGVCGDWGHTLDAWIGNNVCQLLDWLKMDCFGVSCDKSELPRS